MPLVGVISSIAFCCCCCCYCCGASTPKAVVFSVSELLTSRCFAHEACNILPSDSENSSFILFSLNKELIVSAVTPIPVDVLCLLFWSVEVRPLMLL